MRLLCRLRLCVSPLYSSLSLIPAAVDSFLSSSHLRRSRRELEKRGNFFLCFVEFSFARTRDGCLFATIGRRFSERGGEEDPRKTMTKRVLFVVGSGRDRRRASFLLFLLLFFFYFFFFFFFFFSRHFFIFFLCGFGQIYPFFLEARNARAHGIYAFSHRRRRRRRRRSRRKRERRASLARESPFYFFLYSIERDEKTRQTHAH